MDWSAHPAAERVVAQLVRRLTARAPWLARLRRALRERTATELTDWLDHLAVPAAEVPAEAWRAAGFAPVEEAPGLVAWRHGGGRFPVLVGDAGLDANAMAAALRVESVDEAVAALGGAVTDGAPGAQWRRARLAGSMERAGNGDWTVWAVERHGWPGFVAPLARASDAGLRHLDAFRERSRHWLPGTLGRMAAFANLERLVAAAVADLGQDEACARFFAAERDYWQSRNRAARIQRGRQDAFGLGWANHDHHTYRSSRAAFGPLIAVLERLGLRCRERFHAGAEAGWGAQVLESPGTGIVVFADVDLLPEEQSGDLAHRVLPPLPRLGTVGLWCALHGEALFDAGMHHLECTFLHDRLTRQLAAQGVAMMKPFTDLPLLKQAFTVGERWPVAEERLAMLHAAGLLDAAQVARFRAEGAIGSHLENLERRGGFKGFNQRGVSHIIAGTDPRRGH